MKLKKRIGWISLTIVPLIISLVAQLALGILLSVICSVIAAVQMGASGATDVVALQELATELAYQNMGLMILVYHILATIGFGVWYYFGCGRPKAAKPATVFRGKCVPATVVLSIGLCLFANAFVMVVQYVAPNAYAKYELLMESAGMGMDPFTILASVVLAPIGEELLCRGLIFHYAKKAVSDMNNRRVAFWIANALQSIMFGIMHGNLIQGLYAFFLGLAIGWLRERYNSLYPAMLAHFIINFSSTFLTGHLLTLLPEGLAVAVIFMVVSIAITFAGFFLGKESKDAEAIVTPSYL